MIPSRRSAERELASHELALRRSAAQRVGQTAEAELADVLDHVADRRAARSPSTLHRSRAGRSAGTPIADPDVDGAGSLLASDRPAGRSEGGPPNVLLESVASGPRARILRVGRPAGLSFRPGQYVKVGLEGAPDRKFSLASAPGDPALEFCVELIAGGALTPRLFAASPGDTLRIGSAAGSFVLQEAVRTHLLIATFTGIAPLRAMLRHGLATRSSTAFVVVHGASHHDELPYRDELAALAASDPRVTYTPTVSRPTETRNAGWNGRTGRVGTLAIEAAAGLDPDTTHAYACGNSEMVREVRRDLSRRGFDVSSETFD